jgi:hypothetical protein
MNIEIPYRRLPFRRGVRVTLFEVPPSEMTKLHIEMFPGTFIGVTIPTRYLVWSDDRPGEPQILWNEVFRRCKLETKR